MMTVLRSLIEKLTNRKIFKILPHGMDVFADIDRRVSGYLPGIIFDVGAGDGRYTLDYASRFPDAKLFSIEPIEAHYTVQQRNLAHVTQVVCHPLALSDSEGTAEIEVGYKSPTDQYAPSAGASQTQSASEVEEVRTVTLSQFCSKQGVDHIGFLRLDAGTNDLKVLAGGKEILANAKIDFIQVKASMNSRNQEFVSFENQKRALEKYGYSLFGIYEQASEWPTQEPQLRRANLVFISPYMMVKFRLKPNLVLEAV